MDETAVDIFGLCCLAIGAGGLLLAFMTKQKARRKARKATPPVIGDRVLELLRDAQPATRMPEKDER